MTKQKQPQLLVGNSKQAQKMDMSLEEYLAEIKPNWELVWLNMNNLSEDNALAAYSILDELNNKHKLRNNTIIESDNAQALSVFSENGWNCSLNISAHLLKMKKGNTLNTVDLQNIKNRMLEHHIKGVSFNSQAINDATLDKLAQILQGTKLYLRHDEWLYSEVNLNERLKKDYTAYLLTLDSPFDLPKK